MHVALDDLISIFVWYLFEHCMTIKRKAGAMCSRFHLPEQGASGLGQNPFPGEVPILTCERYPDFVGRKNIVPGAHAWPSRGRELKKFR